MEELALEQFLTAARTVGASTDAIERRDHADGLLAYLAALAAPPSDEDVRTILPAEPGKLRARFAGRSQSNAEVLADLDKTARLHRAWLSDIDRTPRDPVTGLPQEAVDARRSFTHRLLGEVPVGLAEARAEAWLAASEDDRAAAAAALSDGHGGGRQDATEWRWRKSVNCLPREILVDLLGYAAKREEDFHAAAALWELWRQGGLRELVEDFLDRSTTQ